MFWRVLAAAMLLLLQAGASLAQGRMPTRRAPGRSIPIPRGFPIPVQSAPDAWAGGPVRPGPIPFPASSRRWIRIETDRFTIFSSVGKRTTRAVAADLEAMATRLLATGRLFMLPRGRSRVFLFGNRGDVQSYFDVLRGARVNATGMTLRHPLGSTTLIDATARGGVTLTPRHELVHDLIHRESHAVPLWVEEGLAEYYSNNGLPIREHLLRLRGRLPLPLPAMLTMTAFAPRAGSLDFYAQSWAATYTLIRKDQDAFFALAEDLAAGTDPQAALQSRFGMTIQDLGTSMRKGLAPAMPPRTPSSAALAAVAPLSHGELLFELGELLARFDGGQPEAERHFRAAVEAEPGNASLALRFAERLSHEPGRGADARDCALVAAAAGAPAGDVHAILGAAHAVLAQPEVARPHLEAALDLKPEDTESAWHLYAVYMRLGERALADGLLPALLHTDRAQDVRRLLLAADLDRADALARLGRYGEAARVLRELAPKMPPKTRASIESEVARLEGAAGER